MAYNETLRVYEDQSLAALGVVVAEEDPDVVASRLQQLSVEFESIACLMTSQDSGGSMLHFVNYPRAKHGTRTPEVLAKTTDRVAQELDGDVCNLRIQGAQRFVYVTGLREGYDGNIVHTVSDVRAKMSSLKSAESLSIKKGTVISVNPREVYTEPAVRIRFGIYKILPRLLSLASELGQERVSFENHRYGRVFMVETELCTEPDQLVSTSLPTNRAALLMTSDPKTSKRVARSAATFGL